MLVDPELPGYDCTRLTMRAAPAIASAFLPPPRAACRAPTISSQALGKPSSATRVGRKALSTLLSPERTRTKVSSHTFCSVLRLWCMSIMTDRPPLSFPSSDAATSSSLDVEHMSCVWVRRGRTRSNNTSCHAIACGYHWRVKLTDEGHITKYGKEVWKGCVLGLTDSLDPLLHIARKKVLTPLFLTSGLSSLEAACKALSATLSSSTPSAWLTSLRPIASPPPRLIAKREEERRGAGA